MPGKLMRRAVKRQEENLADVIGGRRQKGSGALPWAKGDAVKKGVWRGEAKQTQKKSYVLKLEILEKLRSECAFGESPIMSIQFTDKDGSVLDSWILVPEEVWRKHAGKD